MLGHELGRKGEGRDRKRYQKQRQQPGSMLRPRTTDSGTHTRAPRGHSGDAKPGIFECVNAGNTRELKPPRSKPTHRYRTEILREYSREKRPRDADTSARGS